MGRGHAPRDAVEWMIPPLWPLKVPPLPARGPRRTLKGEEQLTLRLMDDVVLPATPLARWSYLGMSSLGDWPHQNDAVPIWYVAPQVRAAARSSTAKNLQVAPGAKAAPSSDASGTATSATQNVLTLRNGTSYVATALHMDDNRLSDTQGDGTLGTGSPDTGDMTETFQNNAENGAVLAVNSESARR